MSQPSPADALVQRILEGGAPLTLRQAAARGALPLPRAVLARLYVHLLGDAEEPVRQAADASLAALAPDAIAEVIGDPSCAPAVLRHYAARAARDVGLAERLAFHAAAPDEALTVLALEGTHTVIDLVLTNQEKLLGSPGLLDALMMNPALRPDQRGRILDVIDSFLNRRDASEAVAGEAPADGGEAVEADLARLLEVDVGELFAASEILGGEEFERAEDPAVRGAYQRILRLGPAQKAMLAMKGGRDERMILIRDTNRVVALSVLKNPRLTDHDVEEIARARNVSDVVLRSLGASREWSKRYTVASALVRNPRTPPGISLNFVSRLVIHDLKGLIRDKNVPEVIRRMAKKTYELRTQKSKLGFKKK